jgi:hypothetical protein
MALASLVIPDFLVRVVAFDLSLADTPFSCVVAEVLGEWRAV